MEERNRVRRLLADKLPVISYSKVTDEQVDWLLQNDYDAAELLEVAEIEDIAIPPFTLGLRCKIVQVFSIAGLSLSVPIHDVLGSESI